MMIYRCVAMFILPDADFADDAEERRSFTVLKENKSAFFCVICARLRPVNTSQIPNQSRNRQNIILSFPLAYYFIGTLFSFFLCLLKIKVYFCPCTPA